MALQDSVVFIIDPQNSAVNLIGFSSSVEDGRTKEEEGIVASQEAWLVFDMLVVCVLIFRSLSVGPTPEQQLLWNKAVLELVKEKRKFRKLSCGCAKSL